MTLLTAAVVTLVVWSVSLVHSVRLRALIYSLPLPITLVLLTTDLPVGAQHLIGVLLLVAFVAVVTWLHHRWRWHILLADLAGAAVYIAGSWVLVRLGRLPFTPVLVGTLVSWALFTVAFRRSHPPPDRTAAGPPAPDGLPALGKLLVVAAGALLMTGLGWLLRGMVVTFPYSGVLVVVETRRDLVEFRAHFARNSLGLVAFLTAFHAAQGVSRPVATAAGWSAFLGTVALLHLTGRWTGDGRPEPDRSAAQRPRGTGQDAPSTT